jgi:primary-amine oxidase
MPVDYSGFALKPYGFLDRNPALDLPDGGAGRCSPATAAAPDTGCCGGGECRCHH